MRRGHPDHVLLFLLLYSGASGKLWHVSSRTVPGLIPVCQKQLWGPILVNSISPWSGASWKIVEWNVPPALGFGNSKRFLPWDMRMFLLSYASEWADSAIHCSLHLDWERRLEPPLLMRGKHGKSALMLAVYSVNHALVIQQPKNQPRCTLRCSAFSGPDLTRTGTGVRARFTHPIISSRFSVQLWWMVLGEN